MPLLFAGCQKNGLRLVPVSGRVTLNGVPVEGARINFYSGSGNETDALDDVLATAVTDTDGNFEMMTRESTGALVGKHRVTIQKHEPPPEESLGSPGAPTGGPKGKGGKGKGGKGANGNGGDPDAKKATPDADALVKMAKGAKSQGGQKAFAAAMSIPVKPNLLPWKYADYKTSEFGYLDVPEAGVQDLEFKLVGEPGGAPPPPVQEDEDEDKAAPAGGS